MNKLLKRTEGFKTKKTKIIVHHTAKSYNGILTKEDALKEVQNIYKYHAVNRGWGDIGYNFIIDHFGNVYEGRAGGEGVIGAHAKRNNAPSIGIALIGNFNTDKLTSAAKESLVKLLIELSKKYDINPEKKIEYHKDSKDFPYISDFLGFSIAGHKDAGYTACPGSNLYKQLPQIRQQVVDGLSNYDSQIDIKSNIISSKLISHITEKGKQKSVISYSGMIEFREQMKSKTEVTKNKYLLKKSSNNINKIEYKISKQEAKMLINQDINVLLYELTFNFTGYKIQCFGTCEFDLDGNKYTMFAGDVYTTSDNLVLNLSGNLYVGKKLKINSSKDIIMFKNYNRKSYQRKPWNLFRGTILIHQENVNDKKLNKSYRFVVINSLPFQDYLKGIVETNDTETIEKNKLMSLLAKTYAIFYMKNTHPSILSGASYNAVDDPDIFQKYVGAGLEFTLKKRPLALKATKNQIISFDGYIPILPYFNCSPGFTYSAEDKRGWKDTPYLKLNLDVAICKNFAGHGVGMSGKGAEHFAKNGWTMAEIIQYYYSGVQLEIF